jgi:hypothetical protein
MPFLWSTLKESCLMKVFLGFPGDGLLAGEWMNGIEDLREACVGDKLRTNSMTLDNSK